MVYNKEKIVNLLKLRKTGNKGWMIGPCQYCGKPEHMAVIFGDVSSFRCHSGKCHAHGTLWKLLEHIGRLDLLDLNKRVILNQKLNGNIDKFTLFENLDYSTPVKRLPLGFKRVYTHSYLESRGFTQKQFEKYIVGQTSIDLRLKNRIIFSVESEGESKGWLARSLYSKEELDKINKKRVEQGKYKILRYQNSIDTDFGKLLFGYDEIIEGVTKEVILVEGITDKFNIDRLLNLDEVDFLKCNSSFGKVISDYHIAMLLTKGIEKIILLYDPDAINNIKEYGLKIYELFKEVGCGFINYQDKDPGDLNEDEVLEVLSNLEDPIQYNLSKLPKYKLV